ncbi:Uncharacterised protein [Vibrio cholerae]|nr:Uncharacterised protein [Vibrio cholerae]
MVVVALPTLSVINVSRKFLKVIPKVMIWWWFLRLAKPLTV